MLDVVCPNFSIVSCQICKILVCSRSLKLHGEQRGLHWTLFFYPWSLSISSFASKVGPIWLVMSNLSNFSWGISVVFILWTVFVVVAFCARRYDPVGWPMGRKPVPLRLSMYYVFHIENWLVIVMIFRQNIWVETGITMEVHHEKPGRWRPPCQHNGNQVNQGSNLVHLL